MVSAPGQGKLKALGAAALSGALLWLSSPPVGLWPLAWIALAPVAAVVLADPASRRARLAVPTAYLVYLELLLVPALPFGLADGQWQEAPGVLMIGDSPVIVVALVAVPGFAALLYGIGFGLPWAADRLPARARPAAAVLIPTAAFAALDFIRLNLDPGGAWGPLFLSQAGEAPATLAALGGPWLLSWAIAATGYGLGASLLSRRAAPALIAASVAVVLVVVAAAFEPGAGPRLRVAVVQAGYDTADERRPALRRWEPGSYDRAAVDVLDDLEPLVAGAADAGAGLIVLPEAVAFVDPRAEPAVEAALARLARRAGVAIVAGFFEHGPDRSGSLLVAADGGIAAAQPKRRPMWFLGEGAIEIADPGAVEVTTAIGPLAVATLLGVDAQDPGVARRLVEGGGELIASATHDFPGLAEQQRALAAITARATAAPLARADWRYGSAIYDSDGEAAADAGDGQRRIALSAEIATGGGATGYRRIGDLVGWAALALAGAAIAAARLGRRRPERRSSRLVSYPRAGT